MSLGTGIFLSALVVSAVVLFLGTKDRWDWPRLSRMAVAQAKK